MLENSDLYKKLKLYIWGRLAIVTVLFIATLVIQFQNHESVLTTSWQMLYAIIGVSYLFSLASLYLFKKQARFRHALSYAQLLYDVILITFFVYLTGGNESFFSFLYILNIINGSVLLFQKGALFSACFGIIGYASILLAEFYTWIPESGSRLEPVANYDMSDVLQAIFLHIFYAFVTAILSSHLASRQQETSEALEQSRKELEKMEMIIRQKERLSAIGTMAANMAHEIRNPLTSISGSLQLIRDKLHSNEDESVQQLLDITLKEGGRLNRLIGEFLEFVDPSQILKQKNSIHQLLKEAVESFENSRGSQSIKHNIITQLEDSDVMVDVDSDRIKQVLWNLFTNAVYAMPNGGDIRILLHTQKSGVTLSVEDQGKGISADHLDYIYDPFFTTKSDGSGLGLSIVHKIIEAHNGSIHVDSQQGKGSTFTVWLPQS